MRIRDPNKISGELPPDNYTRWYSVDERLPNKNDRYASQYGIGVLTINMDEPNPQPHDANFMWEDNWFEELHTFEREDGMIEREWIPLDPTHWMPMPERPTT